MAAEIVRVATSDIRIDDFVKRTLPELKNLYKSRDAALVAMLPDGKDPLDALDPSLHTAVFAYLLMARSREATAPQDVHYILQRVAVFSETYDAHQATLVPEAVPTLVAYLSKWIETLGNASEILPLLGNFIRRTGRPDVLSTAHRHLVQHALRLRMYAFALPLLAIDVTMVDPSASPIKYQDHLLYHYFGGVILAADGQFSRAVDHLTTAVSAPSTHISTIQIDAYKKLVLVSLLADGQPPRLPRYTSQSIQQTISRNTVPYSDFAAAYANLDVMRSLNLAKHHEKAFTEDRNIGLVSLCIQRLPRRQLLHLTKAFATIPLSTLAAQISLPDKQLSEDDTAALIQQMVSERTLFAEVVKTPEGVSYASFHDDPQTYDTEAAIANLEQREKIANALNERMLDADWQISRSKEFVSKAWHNSGAGGGGMGGMMGMNDDFDSPMPGWEDSRWT